MVKPVSEFNFNAFDPTEDIENVVQRGNDITCTANIMSADSDEIQSTEATLQPTNATNSDNRAGEKLLADVTLTTAPFSAPTMSPTSSSSANDPHPTEASVSTLKETNHLIRNYFLALSRHFLSQCTSLEKLPAYCKTDQGFRIWSDPQTRRVEVLTPDEIFKILATTFVAIMFCGFNAIYIYRAVNIHDEIGHVLLPDVAYGKACIPIQLMKLDFCLFCSVQELMRSQVEEKFKTHIRSAAKNKTTTKQTEHSIHPAFAL